MACSGDNFRLFLFLFQDKWTGILINTGGFRSIFQRNFRHLKLLLFSSTGVITVRNGSCSRSNSDDRVE